MSRDNAVIIIQARMTSTRLPGKVLMPIAGRPMLSYQLERLRRVRGIDRIVVATTVNRSDDPIAAFCDAEQVPCTRGPEQDVLARYSEAASSFAATTVVRVTSDCPLLDPEVVEQVIDAYAGSGFDYVSNMLEPTWPYGMAVEAFSARCLAEAQAEARDDAEREHVTPFIYWHPQRYRLKSITMAPDLSHHRWTVDTPEDFELVRRIIETLYPRKPAFQMADVLALLTDHPDWVEINRHVAQKSVAPTTKEA